MFRPFFFLGGIVLLSLTSIHALSPASEDTKAGALREWSVGEQSAPVVIEVFNDYQCRPCGSFNSELKRVQVKHSGTPKRDGGSGRSRRMQKSCS